MLLDFIEDTIKNTTSEDAMKVLPEVARVLVDLNKF